MTQKQFFNFIKAPFGKSFIVAFIFSFFSLLAVPLVSDVLFTLINVGDKLDAVPQEERLAFFMQAFSGSTPFSDILVAGVGLFAYLLLLSVYGFALTHKTVKENKGVFDASRLSLSLSEIFSAFFKYIGFVLIFVAGIVLSILPAFIFIVISALIGNNAPVLLSILLVILSIVLPFYLLYKVFCHLYTASLIFYKEFDLSVFFDRKRVKAFFLEKKQSIFIAFLLSYVAGQMVYAVISPISLNILENFLPFCLLFGLFSVPGQVIIAIALLVAGFILTYVSILQAIVFGKIILWVGKKK